MLSTGVLYCNGQVGIRVSAGISEITFPEGGQASYLGYEVNSFNGRMPMFSQQWGLNYTHSLNRRFQLSSGLVHTRNGLRYKTSKSYGEIGYNITNHYLTLPLQIALVTNISKDRNSTFYLGPLSSLLVHSGKKIYTPDYLNKTPLQNLKKMNFGIILGYSWDIGKEAKKWFLDTRIEYSLSSTFNLPENSDPLYYNEADLYARSINMLIGVKYHI